MNNQRLQELLRKTAEASASPEELDELLGLLEHEDEQQWLPTLSAFHEVKKTAAQASYNVTAWDQTVTSILQVDKPAATVQRRINIRSYWWQAAAVIALLLVSATWLLRKPAQQPVAATGIYEDINPGKKGALLTLADGSVLALDSLQNGVIASQSGTQVQLQDGQLSYTTGNSGTVTYNTMSTPRGRQFQLVLPDGTHVWLNAASSIQYPTAFTGSERKVTVTGEAYFEVAASTTPFRVNTNHQQVEVLGTRFNINAYDDEPVYTTTLQEGRVRIHAGADKSVLLAPGQQAATTQAIATDLAVKDVDANLSIAWKNGYFEFEHETLAVVVRSLSRWYNIDFALSARTQELRFSAVIDRNDPIEKVLELLATTEAVQFTRTGNTITVAKSK